MWLCKAFSQCTDASQAKSNSSVRNQKQQAMKTVVALQNAALHKTQGDRLVLLRVCLVTTSLRGSSPPTVPRQQLLAHTPPTSVGRSSSWTHAEDLPRRCMCNYSEGLVSTYSSVTAPTGSYSTCIYGTLQFLDSLRGLNTAPYAPLCQPTYMR